MCCWYGKKIMPDTIKCKMKVCTAFVRTEMEKLCWLHSLGKLFGLNTGSNHRADRYQEFITRRIKRKTERWATSPGLQSCGSFVNVIDFSVSPESCFYFETERERKGEGSDSAEEKITIWVKIREEWRRMKRDSHLHRYSPNQIAWIHHCILRGRRTGDEEWSAPITAWCRQIKKWWSLLLLRGYMFFNFKDRKK